MMELTGEQLASELVSYWASNAYSIQLQAGPFSFKDHEYQLEPIDSISRRICYMKATQGGFTELEVLRSLHAMIHRRLPRGVLYMFPNTDVVREFSKSRFDPLIQSNREAIGKYVKSTRKSTDTASLKKIHDAFLYLRGARLSQKISDQNESIQMSSIPVDRLVFDEVDKMDSDVIGKARGRLGHSKVKEEVYISNPLVPGEGIDKIFQTSDQRYWYRLCKTCDEWTCAEKFFMEDPERCVGVRADGTGYIACHNCGREVHIRDGEWRPDLPENTDFMRGYQWSQLTSAFNDPLEILRDFRNPPEGNLGDVYRLRLGLPWIAAEDRLTLAQVYDCCGDYPSYHSHQGPCAMGVDVGKIKHVVLGAKIGGDKYQIFKTLQISSWEDIHDIAVKFGVKSAVIDIRPYEDSARAFQAAEGYKIYLCEYKENQPQGAIYNDNSGIVSVNRTEIFDRTHRLVTSPGALRIPRYSPAIKEFAKQMCGAYKILDVNKKSGQAVYRYRGENEHFRNAMNYFLLAAKGLRRFSESKKTVKHQTVNNDYKRF